MSALETAPRGGMFMTIGKRFSTAARYGTAVLCTAGGIVLRFALDPLFDHNQVLFPFPLVVVAAALTLGRGPALLATATSVLAAWFFFVAPQFSFAVEHVSDVGVLITLAVIGVLISFVIKPYRQWDISQTQLSSRSWPRIRRLIAFAAGVAAIGATTKLVLDDFNRQDARQSEVEHVYQVLRAEQGALSNLQEAETGQRGYLLTGDEKYLEPYREAVKEAPAARLSLRQMTADNPALQAGERRLEQLAQDKYAELQQSIKVRREDGPDAALDVVQTGRGKRIMDEARSVLAGVQTEELRLLKERTDAADYESMRTHWVLGIGGVSLVMMLLVAGTMIERDIGERERAAERLAVAHHKTAVLLESISDGFVALDTDWRYSFVNPAAGRMLGRKPGDLLGRNLWEVWPLLAELPSGAAYRRAVAENIPIETVDHYGEPLNRWFDIRCYPSPEGLTLFYTDTTERRAAKEQSLRLAAIVEGSDDAIISKNLDGIVLSWNEGAEHIYGYAAEEMIGQPISRLAPDNHPDEFPEIMEYLKLGQKIEHLETERIRKDGGRISVSVTLSPLRDETGAIVGASSIARDITGRKQAEHALKRSELRYRSLVRAISQIVWISDARGEVQLDVPAWREFTGQTFEEGRGWGWLQALHPDDRERTTEIWSRAVTNRSFYTIDYRLRRRDGEYRWMTVHGVPMLGENGQIEEWVGTCADITDRVAAEEEVQQLNQTLEKRVLERTAELQAANKELESFAYSVSHDLRAPLRAISGFSRILREEFGPSCPAEAHRYLGIIADNAVQMGSLIDGLLTFSRLGRQALNARTVDPSDLVRLAMADLASEQQGRQVEMRIGDLPACQADPLLLRQVFFNLLSNALKYTRRRECVRVEVGAFQFKELDGQSHACREGAPGGVMPEAPVYYVRDNGAGFDMRYADKLFGVFQRLHRTEEYEGTGVGLATVRRIIARHGGHVWAEGALDQGATFYFTLDRAAEVPGRPAVTDAVSGERS